ncbi:MAG: hypothetical protein WC867_05765 [Candidatus Pacearchaeota archaeon]|jgi:hypothetical protein
MKLIKSKIAATIITLTIISILIISGPANALNIGISLKEIDTIKEFIVNVNPNSGEKLPINDLKVSINDGEECHFNINGSLSNIETCNLIGIVGIEKILSTDKPGNGPKDKEDEDDKHGYSYNYGYNYGYDYSYNYGYNRPKNERLSYKIIVNSSNFPSGEYTFKFFIKIGNGNKYHVEEKSFVVGSSEVIDDNKHEDKNKTKEDKNDDKNNITNKDEKNKTNDDKEKINESEYEDDEKNNVDKNKEIIWYKDNSEDMEKNKDIDKDDKKEEIIEIKDNKDLNDNVKNDIKENIVEMENNQNKKVKEIIKVETKSNSESKNKIKK